MLKWEQHNFLSFVLSFLSNWTTRGIIKAVHIKEGDELLIFCLFTNQEQRNNSNYDRTRRECLFEKEKCDRGENVDTITGIEW